MSIFATCTKCGTQFRKFSMKTVGGYCFKCKKGVGGDSRKKNNVYLKPPKVLKSNEELDMEHLREEFEKLKHVVHSIVPEDAITQTIDLVTNNLREDIDKFVEKSVKKERKKYMRSVSLLNTRQLRLEIHVSEMLDGILDELVIHKGSKVNFKQNKYKEIVERRKGK